MRMIPPVISETVQSDAERRIFTLLEQTDLGPNAVAYHSLNLAQHDYKVSGEIDFLVVTPEIVLVLEVKGGGVSFHSGVWVYTDRYRRQHRTSEGPFRQAQSAMYSLRRRLVERFSEAEVRGLTFGFGVVFPDDNYDADSVEWSQRIVLDARRLRRRDSLEDELTALQGYWTEKVGNRRPADIPLLERTQAFLRPEFDLVPSLAHRADQLDVKMEKLTAEQYERLDLIEDSPRILCEGGAGTGKTFLAVETAKRHAAKGKTVLLVCRSPTLASFLRGRLRSANVRVTSWENVPGDEVFDVLIIDEGQDILDLEAVAILDSLVTGGIEGGTWRIFLDINNQSAIHSRLDVDALELLRGAGSVPGSLRRNCRNTHEVVLQTKLMTGADLGSPSAGHGPPVTWEYYEAEVEAAGLLASHIRDLYDAGEEPADITIVSALGLDESLARKLPKKILQSLVELDEQQAERWPVPHLTFSTISDFKGLENRFVAVIDIDSIGENDSDLAALYVAMSRARVGLWIALPKRLESEVERVAKNNLEGVLNDARVR